MDIGVLAGSVLPMDIENRCTIIGRKDLGGSCPIFTMEEGDDVFHILSRHGMPPTIPPHKIDHRANVKALKEMGSKVLISICSSGSLRQDIKVPSIAIPDDYIDLWSGSTFIDDHIEHISPGLNEDLMEVLFNASIVCGVKARKGGTYIQTRGPRLETKAEVRVLSGWGDYVGMNLGSEATLAREISLPLAGLLTVDNYANGIGTGDLDFNIILSEARAKWDILWKILKRVPDRWI